MPIGRKDYKARKTKKVSTYRERTSKAQKESDSQRKKAADISSYIPLGQPILVGHHSEKRHRRDIKKIETAYRKSREADEKADYYESRIDTVENNKAISGDNPEAINLYKQKLDKLIALQERMKAINKVWKKGKDALIALGLNADDIEKLKNGMHSYETKPYPTWALSNQNQEIQRIKNKIASLTKLDEMSSEVINFVGGRLFINTEINRVQFLFDNIPSKEIRTLLKSNGFKWSPKEKAWQRQRTLNALSTAKGLLSKLS